MAYHVKDTVPLLSGHTMPVMGIGTWLSKPSEIEVTVDTALEMGYRHIDTAFSYFNETAIGTVLQKWFTSGKLRREELFLTTKLPGIAMRPERVKEYVDKSLKALQLDYLDCFLIHSPIGIANQGDDSNIFPVINGRLTIETDTDLAAIWNALEDELESGKIRTIGVSNFTVEQIQKVNASAKKHRIAVNQVELHAYFQQKALHQFCTENSIVLMAYGPLGSPGRLQLPHAATYSIPPLLSEPHVWRIARAHRVTPAQVLLHHLAKKGIVVIPKSTNPARIQLNYQIFNFSLTDEETKVLDSLDQGEKGRSFLFDFVPGILEHPEHFLRYTRREEFENKLPA